MEAYQGKSLSFVSQHGNSSVLWPRFGRLGLAGSYVHFWRIFSGWFPLEHDRIQFTERDRYMFTKITFHASRDNARHSRTVSFSVNVYAFYIFFSHIFTFPVYVTIFLNAFNLSTAFSYIPARPALFFILFKRTCNIFHPFSVFWHTFFFLFARSSFINILLFSLEWRHYSMASIFALFFITFCILLISFPFLPFPIFIHRDYRLVYKALDAVIIMFSKLVSRCKQVPSASTDEEGSTSVLRSP